MGKAISVLFVFVTLLLIGGCAELIQAQKDNTCNRDAAYATGVNDGRLNKDMQANYASICDLNQNSINAAYRRGYRVGLRSGPRTEINVNTGGGRGRGGRWGCISTPWRKVCGYGCIKDNFNKVYCGAKPYDNCVKNNFNRVKCGRHCRVADNFGKLVCDRERYSKSSDKP